MLVGRRVPLALVWVVCGGGYLWVLGARGLGHEGLVDHHSGARLALGRVWAGEWLGGV